MVLNILILIFSIVVYGSYGLSGLAFLAGASALSYLAGRLHRKAPWLTWISILLTAAVLVLLKVQPYTTLCFMAPMGISYYSLRLISYNADVARGSRPPEKNAFAFGLYAFYLPYLFMGPIESYDPNRFRKARLSWEGLFQGGARILWGALNGIFVCFGEKLKTRFKTLNRIGMFLAVSLLWSFFIWPKTGTALEMLGSLFTAFDPAGFLKGIGDLGLNLGDWIVLGAGCGILWLCDCRMPRLVPWFKRLHPAWQTALMGALGLLILVFGMYGIGFNASAFIYSQF